MNKLTKRILLITMAALVALIGTYCVLRFAFGLDVLDQSGWHTKDGAVRYLDYWGRPQTGWQTIENQSYYFAENGNMVTGWYGVGENTYYFDASGIRAHGWLQLDSNRFYLGEDGALVTGWLSLEDSTYYFAPEDGRMATGWIELEGQRYYLDEAGRTQSGWTELEGVRYHFGSDGAVSTQWYEDDTGRYFFGIDGTPQSGWLEWEQKHYYLKPDGSVTTGWLELEGDRYYFLPTGRMAIGQVEVDGVSRFFTSKGKETLMCNPWYAIPEDFQLDLVNIGSFKIDRQAQQPLQQMMDACRAAGIYIGINNSYRSHQTQLQMWNNRISQRMAAGMTKAQAEAKTGESLAIPGHSEHETGLAFDVNSGTKVYKWLAENCWDYGFILRYPDDRMEITGIIYEPWHFRYVGTELSLELEELGLCMEEYFSMLTQQQAEIAD